MNTTLERVTVPSFRARKNSDKKISVLTAYDYTSAVLLDSAGIDALLVGDSLGMVIQGQSTTLPVELEHSIYHTTCVARGVKRALVIADMPFLSYQVSPEQATESAGRLLKAGASAVKLEGGAAVASTVARLVSFDIPVMGHVGLTPQSVHRMGGNKIQGRGKSEGAGSREQILRDAQLLDEAGVFSIVIEGVPADLAAEITEAVSVPTIGIGAGAACDGQVLVMQDMLGMMPNFSPKFLKKYANLNSVITEAVQTYIEEVQTGKFPSEEHSFGASKSKKIETVSYGGKSN
jgi:3-methyl-2-oxobutanoate hydroxymethyltransferase